MSNHTEVMFKLDIHHEDSESLSSLIHEALLEFTAQNKTGEWPPNEPYTAANGVRIVWERGE